MNRPTVARQLERPRLALGRGRPWGRRSRPRASRSSSGSTGRRTGRPSAESSAAAGFVAPRGIAVGQAEAVVGGDVLRVDRERAAVGRDRLPEALPALGALDRLDAAPGRRAPRQRVDHLVIEAEVEPPVGDPGRQDRLEAGDRLVEHRRCASLIWPVSQLITQGAAGFSCVGGLLEGGQGVGDPPFLLVDPGQVHPAVGLARARPPSGRPARPASARPSGPPCRPLRAAGRSRSRSSAARLGLIGEGSFSTGRPALDRELDRGRCAITTTGSSGPFPLPKM